jgi:uridine monophosphate synthetase
MVNKTDLIVELHNNGVIQLKETTLKSGVVSPYYCDFRRVGSNPELFKNLLDYLKSIVEDMEEDGVSYEHIAGVPYGGISLAVGLGINHNKSVVIPRTNKKQYGNKKDIEGIYEIGDTILLIEDTVTSGVSVLETIKKIEKNGCLVENVIVLLDREEGGVETIRDAGYQVETVFQINKVLNTLVSKQLIDDFKYESVANFVNVQRNIYLDKLGILDGEDAGDNIKNNSSNSSKTSNNTESSVDTTDESANTSLDNFDPIFHHNLQAELLRLVYDKKTALCLSLDVPTWKEGREILDKCGPYIAMVKTHVELFEDYTSDYCDEIKELAKKHKFLVMEDRKLADVSTISWKQTMGGLFNINKWANFVTCHGLTASSCLDYYQQRLNGGFPVNVAPCLVTEMNADNNMLSKNYTKECLQLIQKHSKVSPVIICQCLPNITNKIKATPGVSLNETENVIDGKNYRTVENAIVYQNNHIVIVGSSIVSSEEPDEEAKLFAETSWKYFAQTYPKLVEQIPRFVSAVSK